MAQVKRHWFSRLTFGTAALAVAALLVLSYASALVNPARLWLFSLPGLLYIPLAVTALVFLIWSVRRRAPIGWLLALTLLPSVSLAGRYLQLRKPAEERGAIRIVSYNVGLFAHGNPDTPRLRTADSTAAWLRSLDADVICLQEFYLPNSVSMDAWLRRAFPGYQPDYYVLTGKNGHAGNVTLSRLRVENKGKMDFEKSTNLALYTDICFPGGVRRIYNCHFESYNISLSRLIKSMDEETAEDTGRKMRRSIRQRPCQVDAVLRDIGSSTCPALVVGDFNDTPLSYTYHRLSRGRKDSFTAAGSGFGATYREAWPLLRIDYLLFPQGMTVRSHETPKMPWSDHYPVLVTCDES